MWQDVLPVNIYCKAMGTLLNTAIAEMIGRITALEVRADTDLDASLIPHCDFIKKVILQSYF